MLSESTCERSNEVISIEISELFSEIEEKKRNKKITQIVDVAEDLGWSVRVYDDEDMEFSKFSQAGEDFSFTFNIKGIKNIEDEVMEYYKSFDVEDHVFYWLKAKENGVHGIPNLETLLEDAKNIDEELKILAEAIKKC